VAPATDLPFVIREGLHVWLTPPPRGVREGIIEGVRQGPKGVLVKIEGIDSIEAASATRGCLLMVQPHDVPELDEFEPEPEVLGMSVRTDEGRELGCIVETIETGANDVWVVRDDAGTEVLLPVIDDVVLEIDPEAATAVVHLLPGLIEDEGGGPS